MGTVAWRTERCLGTLVVRGARRERWLASRRRLDVVSPWDRRMELLQRMGGPGGPGVLLPRNHLVTTRL